MHARSLETRVVFARAQGWHQALLFPLAGRLSSSKRYMCLISAEVKRPNKRHFGSISFVPCRLIVLILEVDMFVQYVGRDQEFVLCIMIIIGCPYISEGPLPGFSLYSNPFSTDDRHFE